MLPVAVLPVAGLLLGIGATDFHTQSTVALAILSLMKNAGDVIFGNLPLIFAVGVALGFTENDGVAAIAAVFWIRTREVHLAWDGERRWPLSLTYGQGSEADRDLATTEIAVVESQTQR